MKTYRFRILNVFAETRLGGNPLAVIEDARGLDSATMQALALQFNLSETTLIEPAEQGGAAKVRIFTPTFEMPFAGHPTLGTAHVVRDMLRAGERFSLEMKVGLVPVSGEGDVWTLEAKPPQREQPSLSREALAGVLGVATSDILEGAAWLNTGARQLIVPLASVDALQRAAPNAQGLATLDGEVNRRMVYVFARVDAHAIRARFFFSQFTSVVEDPATGSACANLGGWLSLGGERAVRYRVLQGDQVKRPSVLHLHVDEAGRIFVSGRVIELARGELDL